MKYKNFAFTIIAILFFIPFQSSSQTLYFYDIDASEFPKMKAAFFAFDINGDQITDLAIEDVLIFEDGKHRQVTSVLCQPSRAERSSIALSLDISGSMIAIHSLSRQTAINLVNALSIPPSEMAIQSSHATSFINKDFTMDKQRLFDAIGPITAGGGNDFVEHLLNPYTGLLNIAKTGQFKRSAVIFSDAYWKALTDDELQRAIDLCIENNITFFTVIYSPDDVRDNGIKSSLISISKATGGLIFDGVLTLEKANQITKVLQNEISNFKPCTVEWLSLSKCANTTDVIMRLDAYWLSAKEQYTHSSDDRPRLVFTPDSVRFDNINRGDTDNRTVTVTASSGNIDVYDIGSSDPQYSVDPDSFNLIEGESKNLRITFAPNDIAKSTSTFLFSTDMCPASFNAYGIAVDTTKEIPKAPLILTFPNGGEKFHAGTDTIITWAGILPEEHVTLEYSINAGRNWLNITDRANGLINDFKVPDTISDSCLMKVTFKKEGRNAKTIKSTRRLWGMNSHLGKTSIFWGPNEEYIIISEENRRNAEAINIVSEYQSKPLPNAVYAKISPDGRMVATSNPEVSLNRSIINLYSFPDMALINSTRFAGVDISYFDWSPNSRTLAIPHDDSIILWSITNRDTFPTFYCLTEVKSVKWSPSGQYILVEYHNKNVRVFNCNNNTIEGNRFLNYYLDIEWHPSRDLLAVASRDVLGSRVIDMNGRKIIETYDNASLVAWSPSVDLFAFTSNGRLRIFDRSGNLLLDEEIYFNIGYENNDMKWSPNGNLLAITGDRYSTDNSLILELGDIIAYPMQDVSDNLWSIVKPAIEAIDINFGLILAGNIKDSVINPFISNIGNWPAQIDSIIISGGDADQFRLASGFPQYEIKKAESGFAEFSFMPTSAGSKTAGLVIYSPFDTLYHEIRGEAVAPQFELAAGLINFGKVRTGDKRDMTIVLLRNLSGAEIAIDSSVMLGPDLAQFEILEGKGPFTFNDTHTMKIEFAPIEIGRASGQIGFYYNNIGSPAIAVLFGEGVASPIIYGDEPVFDTLICSQETSDTITIGNKGEVPLDIFESVITGPDKDDFRLQADLSGVSVRPMDSIPVKIYFAPQSPGEKNAKLIIKSNADPDSVFIIRLAGRRQALNFTVPADTVDFGVLCPNNSTGTSMAIRNNSTIQTSFKLSEPGPLFSIVGDNPFDNPFEAGQEKSLNIIFEGSGQTGIYEQSIIVSDSCGNSKEINLKAEVKDFPASYNEEIGFGSPTLSYNKDTVVSISNTGGIAVDIVSIELPANSDIFKVESVYSLPLSIPKGGTFDLSINYSPAELRNYTDRIIIEFGEPCSQTIYITLRGSATLHTMFRLPDTSGQTGAKDFKIPVKTWLTGIDSNLIIPGQSYTAELMFHASAFSPNYRGNVRFENNNAIVTISGSGVTLSKDTSTIYELAGTVLLANNPTTPIYFRSIKWENEFLTTDTISGSIEISACAYDLKHLLPFEPATMEVSPNPAAEYVSISIRTQETGLHQLFLYSTEGVLVHKVEFDKTDSKEVSIYNQDINILNIHSGMYRFILRTPMQVISEKLVIIK